jgi:hypothetical protein
MHDPAGAQRSAAGTASIRHIVDDKYEASFGCALGLLRWNANAQPVNWLRGMRPSVTRDAAAAHDSRIAEAAVSISRAHLNTTTELSLSLEQMALPVLGGFGGGGLTSAQAHAPAHFVAATARSVRACRRSVPGLAHLDISPSSTVSLAEAAACHKDILEQHAATADVYKTWDLNFIDHTTFGDKTFQYHPPCLPTIAALPSVADLADPDSKLSCATRVFAAVTNHSNWLKLYRAIEGLCDNARTGFFISTCQPGAGDFLNCLPATAHQPTDLLRIAFQRRFRVRLNPPPPPEYDPWGDQLQNSGQHTTRHTDLNEVWELILGYAYGAHNLIVDPRKQGGPVDWSPGHIPDITVLNKGPGGFHIVADTKCANIACSHYHEPLDEQRRRSASIPFAASGEYYSELVHGRPKIERPPGTTSRFKRREYSGKKVAAKGDYEPAVELGHTALVLLSEVTGALHPEARSLLSEVAKMQGNKIPLNMAGQSWTATTFSGLLSQRLSSAVNMAAAAEIRNQLVGAARPPPAKIGGTRHRSFRGAARSGR